MNGTWQCNGVCHLCGWSTCLSHIFFLGLLRAGARYKIWMMFYFYYQTCLPQMKNVLQMHFCTTRLSCFIFSYDHCWQLKPPAAIIVFWWQVNLLLSEYNSAARGIPSTVNVDGGIPPTARSYFTSESFARCQDKMRTTANLWLKVRKCHNRWPALLVWSGVQWRYTVDIKWCDVKKLDQDQ